MMVMKAEYYPTCVLRCTVGYNAQVLGIDHSAIFVNLISIMHFSMCIDCALGDFIVLFTAVC